MEHYLIKIPIKPTSDNWFNFLNESLQLLKIDTIKYITVDFSKVRFLETDDFVVLACLLEKFHQKKCLINFIGGSEGLNKHLDNIKLKKYWETGFNREKFTESINRTTLCLWKISRNMIYSYSQYANRYFTNCLGRGKDLISFASNLDEVFNNVFDHSNSDVSGYIITQFFPKNNKLSFSICDFGVGIPNSINNHMISEGKLPLKETEAIVKALELGYSIKSVPRNAGMGLFNILDLVESSNGNLVIVSNNVYYEKYGKNSPKIVFTNYNFQGTLIKVLVDLNTFDDVDFNNEEQGF